MNNNQDNTKPLNVIPSMNPVNTNSENDTHQFDNDFINRGSNNNELTGNQNNSPLNNSIIPNLKQENNNEEEINPMLVAKKNKFINNNIDADTPSLNALNIDNGNFDGPKIDYSKDAKVQANLQAAKKNTVTITSEGLVFIVIVIVLLVFIFVLPTIFDYVRGITYK